MDHFYEDSFYELATLPVKRARRKPEELSTQERDTLRGLVKATRLYRNPSLKEIAECASDHSLSGTGYYVGTVHAYLRRLADRGYVELPEGARRRGIRLLRTEEEDSE